MPKPSHVLDVQGLLVNLDSRGAKHVYFAYFVCFVYFVYFASALYKDTEYTEYTEYTKYTKYTKYMKINYQISKYQEKTRT